jgi:hypothetical protein
MLQSVPLPVGASATQQNPANNTSRGVWDRARRELLTEITWSCRRLPATDDDVGVAWVHQVVCWRVSWRTTSSAQKPC